ncbi:MAG: addiction module protein [Caldisericota bacterium]|nr:addiction module protein [Caldisericota bacterium]
MGSRCILRVAKAIGSGHTLGMRNLAHTFDFDALSVPERIQLVEDLWDSVAASVDDVPVTAAQRDEIDRRIAAHVLNPQPATSWSDTRTHIEERLRGRL